MTLIMYASGLDTPKEKANILNPNVNMRFFFEDSNTNLNIHS